MHVSAQTVKLKNGALLLVVLWLAVLATALAVVNAAHVSRGYLNQLEIMRREAAQLHVVWGQYLLEQSAWSAYSRIEQEAVERLQMEIPTGERLILIQ